MAVNKILFFVALLLMVKVQFAQNIESNNVLLINACNEKGVPEKALNAIENAREANTVTIDYKIALAQNYYSLADYKQAANLFIEINKLNNKVVNYELAKCYAQLNKPELAVKYLKVYLESKNRLMQRTIKSNKAFFNIDASKEWVELWQTEWYSKYDLMLEDAWFEYNAGNYEEALKMLDHLNDIRKSMVDAHYLKSLTYLKVGESENALVSINRAIEKRDERPKYYIARAQAEIELGKAKKALKSIDLALKIDSNRIDYYFVRAQAFLLAGEFESAEKDLNALMNLAPDFDTYKLAGEIFFEAGEYKSSLKAYNRCIALEKYNAEIYIARGDVFSKIYAYEFADKDYSMALDFKPYDGELFYKRGLARKNQRKADQACQDFKKAFKYKYMKADDEVRSYCQGR
ncbi:MAG: tetratricopeptide repeat protein [Salinivirgaceae bacterium]|nr:tetratricopeptide repeat protein [Salinivirgaceae bacterium]